jgi:hypothetical protein
MIYKVIDNEVICRFNGFNNRQDTGIERRNGQLNLLPTPKFSLPTQQEHPSQRRTDEVMKLVLNSRNYRVILKF